MAINIPTSLSAGGPWLLSGEDLLEIDAIIEANLQALKEEKERSARRYAELTLEEEKREGEGDEEKEKRRKVTYENRKRYLDDQDRRQVTFFLTEGRTVTSESFAEAVNHHGVASEVARGFSLFWRVGKIEMTLKLGGRLSGDDELDLSVSPSDSEVAQQLFGAFQNWMGDHQSTLWLRFARKWRFGIGMALWVWVAFCLVGLGSLRTESAKTSYKEEARRMLQKGMTSQDQQRAVELLLAIQSEYSPSERRSSPTGGFWAISLVGTAVLGTLLSVPKFVIGVWGGRGRLRACQAWLKFAGVTMPMLVFTTIVWKWVIAALGLSR